MGMPIINASSTSRQQAITDIIESVALEQTALSHILNAEGEKIQKVLTPCADFIATSSNTLQDFDFVYEGRIAYEGLNEQGYAFVVFKLCDTITHIEVLAYCLDSNNYIIVGQHYNEVVIKGSSDLTEVNAKRIRHILTASFPYITLAQLKVMCGINTLTEREAVTATQLAIWKLSNNFSMVHSNSNVMQLLNWYLSLTPMDILAVPATIELKAHPVISGINCGVEFLIRSNGKNYDGTPIGLSYHFNKDIIAEYGVVINETTVGDTLVVTVTNIPIKASFSILVNGTQTMVYEAYRYIDSQDLTGLLQVKNYMTAQCDYVCNGICQYNILEVNKSVNDMVDSITSLEEVLLSKLALFGDCLCAADPE